MLTLAAVKSSDVVYDLGCGDGRIVIAAAREFGARGVGVDINPALVEEARRNAALARVEHLVTFRVEDALTTDVSDATVVTLYLLASQNVALRPALMKQLRPGARVVPTTSRWVTGSPTSSTRLPAPTARPRRSTCGGSAPGRRQLDNLLDELRVGAARLSCRHCEFGARTEPGVRVHF